MVVIVDDVVGLVANNVGDVVGWFINVCDVDLLANVDDVVGLLVNVGIVD